MAIGIYAHAEGMTKQQYDSMMQSLEQAGAGSPKGRLFHSCFEEGPSLAIYDIWESQADFEAFGATLMPLLAAQGLDMGKPDVVPMHNYMFG